MTKRKGKTQHVADTIWNYLIIDGLLALLKLLWHGVAFIGKGLANAIHGMVD